MVVTRQAKIPNGENQVHFFNQLLYDIVTNVKRHNRGDSTVSTLHINRFRSRFYDPVPLVVRAFRPYHHIPLIT